MRAKINFNIPFERMILKLLYEAAMRGKESISFSEIVAALRGITGRSHITRNVVRLYYRGLIGKRRIYEQSAGRRVGQNTFYNLTEKGLKAAQELAITREA